jgi:hypothetical protein
MNMYMRRRSKVNRNRQREIREMAEEIYFLSELYKEDDPQKKTTKPRWIERVMQILRKF